MDKVTYVSSGSAPQFSVVLWGGEEEERIFSFENYLPVCSCNLVCIRYRLFFFKEIPIVTNTLQMARRHDTARAATAVRFTTTSKRRPGGWGFLGAVLCPPG